MISLIRVIHDPLRDHTFVAERGRGQGGGFGAFSVHEGKLTEAVDVFINLRKTLNLYYLYSGTFQTVLKPICQERSKNVHFFHSFKAGKNLTRHEAVMFSKS